MLSAAIIAATAAAHYVAGRTPICKCGYVKLWWWGDKGAPEESQHLLDIYTSEINKTASVWRAFDEATLSYRPHQKSTTVGDVFKHEIEVTGVMFHPGRRPSTRPTATCLVLVTPDGQRTMNTHLGAATELMAEDIDETVVAGPDGVAVEPEGEEAAAEGGGDFEWDDEEESVALRQARKDAELTA